MLSDENIYKLRQSAFDGEYHDTAGWALYKSWCRRNPDNCYAAVLKDPDPLAMYLHCGYAPNHAMTEISDLQGHACIPQATSLPGRLWQSMKIFGWNFIRGFHDARIAPCP